MSVEPDRRAAARRIADVVKAHKGPDMRGWVTIGFFAVTFFILWMIRENPALLANASFMQLSGALMTGGPLLIATNLFGGTKSGTEASAATAQTLKAMTEQTTPQPNPLPVTVTNPASDPVQVEAAGDQPKP